MAITKGSFKGRGFSLEEQRGHVAHQNDLRDTNDDMDDERAAGKKVVMKAPGKKPITFQKGGLHQSTGTPQDKPIPAAKMAAAKAGKLGPKAQKQANFAANVLKKGGK